MVLIENISIIIVAIVIMSGAQNAVLSQTADSVRLENAIYFEAGVISTLESSGPATLGNPIAGFGYEKQIAAIRTAGRMSSILIRCGLGYPFFNIQAGLALALAGDVYLYYGAQFIMYYELGSTRSLAYDAQGYLKHKPDRVLKQLLPNIGIGLKLPELKVELIASPVSPIGAQIRYYLVIRSCFKI